MEFFKYYELVKSPITIFEGVEYAHPRYCYDRHSNSIRACLDSGLLRKVVYGGGSACGQALLPIVTLGEHAARHCPQPVGTVRFQVTQD